MFSTFSVLRSQSYNGVGQFNSLIEQQQSLAVTSTESSEEEDFDDNSQI